MKKLLTCESGGVALIFGLTLPVLAGATALGVETASIYHQKERLQAVADSTAVATARELHIYYHRVPVLESAGVAIGETLIASAGLDDLPSDVQVRVSKSDNLVDVRIRRQPKAIFLKDFWSMEWLEVHATAQAYGLSKLCILTLHGSKSESLKVDGGAEITAPDCAVQSNSKDSKSLAVKKASRVTSEVICSGGGADTREGVVEPDVATDCASIDDPLLGRQAPGVGGCDFLNMHIDGLKKTISPGTYCGGLKIEHGAEVFAEPGTYAFMLGKLEVKDTSSLTGDYVSFYFNDDASIFEFDTDTTIDLSAPKDGEMAGILFYESRLAKLDRKFVIKSANARRLLGTIYLPKGVLSVDTKSAVAAESAYTVLIANRVEVKGANLFINADYGGSDVPVPDGVGPTSKKVRLTR